MSSRRCHPRSWASSQRACCFGGSLGGIRRDLGGIGEPLDERGHAGRHRGQLVRDLGLALGRPRDVEPGPLGQFDPPILEPIAQPDVADHVVAVVALDPLEMGRRRPLALAEFQPFLERDDAAASVAQVDLALEAIELLHLLDRVALDRGAQGLPDRAQQVDQDALAEELVHLVFARAVATHQPLQRGRLVRGVVVDVHVGVGREACHEKVHQFLEGPPLGIERELAGRVA